MILLVKFVICLMLRVVYSALPTISIPDILIGNVQPFSTQCSNMVEYSLFVQFTPSITNVKAYGMSLMGYEGVVTSVISFQSQILLPNSSHISIKTSCQDYTLFTRLRFSYIIISTAIPYLNIYNQCFLCPPQNSSLGSRSWQFSLQNHVNAYTDKMKVQSSVSGFNASSYEWNGFDFDVKTTMKLGDTKIYQAINARKETVITSVCITTIVYDFAMTTGTGYKILVNMDERFVDFIDGASRALPPDLCFSYSNSMFYGIADMKIELEAQQIQVMLFDLTVPTNIDSNFKANDNLVKIRLSPFLIRKLNCAVGNKFDPLTYTCVATCPVQMGVDPTTNYCLVCHSTCATCSGTGINQCTGCNNATTDKFRQILTGIAPNECVCQAGYIEEPVGSVVCSKCSDIIEHCDLCTSSTFCSQCAAGYAFSTLTKKCGCLDPTLYLSQSFCLPYPGCINVQHSMNLPNYCTECNATQKFVLDPDSYQCKCENGYIIDPATQTCIDECGDGKVLDTNNTECDDGNNDDFDGCSADCKVQANYTCWAFLQPTVCLPRIDFSISYSYCERQLTSNTATFAFELTPPTPMLSQADLHDCFQFSFQAQVVQYFYDDQTGQLIITTTFEQSLQGATHNFTMNFYSASISAPAVKAEFAVQGMNAWLIMDNFSSIYKFIIYGIALICGLAWILAIVTALMGYKHLSLELMLPIQSIYFVLISSLLNAPGLRSLHFMDLINGYNSIYGFKLKQVTSEDDKRYSYLEYLANLNYFILVCVGCLVVFFIVKGIHFALNRGFAKLIENNEETTKEFENQVKKLKGKDKEKVKQKIDQMRAICDAKIQQNKLALKSLSKRNRITQLLLTVVGYRFCSIMLLLILQASIFYLGTFILYTSEYKEFSSFMNNIACLLAVMVTLVGLAVYPQEKDREIQIDFRTNRMKYSYTKVFVLWYVIFIVMLVVVCSFDVKGVMLIAILMLCLVIVFLVLKNPYTEEFAKDSCARLVLPIIQQIVLTLPCVMLWAVGFLKTLNPTLFFTTTVMIVGCCFIGIVLTAIRIYFEVKHYRMVLREKEYDSDSDQDYSQKEEDSNEVDQSKDQKQTRSSKQDKTHQNAQQDENLKDFQTQMKAKLLSGNEDTSLIFNRNQLEDNAETNKKIEKKKKSNKKSDAKQQSIEKEEHENNYQDKSSDEEYQEEDLQTLKKRLRTGLMAKRNVIKR